MLSSEKIMRPLLALHGIIRQQRRVTAEEVVEAVSRAVEFSEADWSSDELGRWRKYASAFKQLLLSPVVRLVSKTLDLRYEQENLLQGALIVTDIRPVYSEDACQIRCPDGVGGRGLLRLRRTFGSSLSRRCPSIAALETPRNGARLSKGAAGVFAGWFPEGTREMACLSQGTSLEKKCKV